METTVKSSIRIAKAKFDGYCPAHINVMVLPYDMRVDVYGMTCFNEIVDIDKCGGFSFMRGYGTELDEAIAIATKKIAKGMVREIKKRGGVKKTYLNMEQYNYLTGLAK